MYLEVIECLNKINRKINGLPVILSFIVAKVGRISYGLYYRLLFSDVFAVYDIVHTIELLINVFDVILLYGIGQTTENEVFTIYFTLYQAIFR